MGSGAVLCLQDPQQNKEFKGTGLVLFAKNVHGDDDDDDDDDDSLLSWCQIKIEQRLVTEKFVSFEEERSLEKAFKDHSEQQFNV